MAEKMISSQMYLYKGKPGNASLIYKWKGEKGIFYRTSKTPGKSFKTLAAAKRAIAAHYKKG